MIENEFQSTLGKKALRMKLLLNICEIYLGTVLFSLISHSQISFFTYQSKKQRAKFKWGLSENNCLHKGVRLIANLFKNFIRGGVKLKQSVWCEEGNLQFLPAAFFYLRICHLGTIFLLSSIFQTTKHSQNLENDVKTDPTPSISQLKINLALEKWSTPIFSIPITKITAFLEFFLQWSPSFFVSLTKKIHIGPPFHIRFFTKKTIFFC